MTLFPTNKKGDTMNKEFKLQIISLILFITMFVIFEFSPSYGEENIIYLKNLTKVKKDSGYSREIDLGVKDIHYGWSLGEFSISGHTRSIKKDNQYIFLKNVGDTVALNFKLSQNIDSLDGNEKLTIYQDKKGYDKYFETAKMDFGKGALIVRKTNYQNQVEEPTIYTNYLATNNTVGEQYTIGLYEEGDYEVALNYKINKKGIPLSTDSYYRIFIKFSIRNGNSMVYPFDVVTKSELTNTSVTPNGFYLDLAKSRYLDINVKKEILQEGSDGLTTDIRFNSPAKDGNIYTDEGIYTIVVKNLYTDEETIKKIYVGDNKLLIAYVTTGMELSEINEMISQGAYITEEGLIGYKSMEVEKDMGDAEEYINSYKDEKLEDMITFSELGTDIIKKKEKELWGRRSILLILATIFIFFYLIIRIKHRNESKIKP